MMLDILDTGCFAGSGFSCGDGAHTTPGKGYGRGYAHGASTARGRGVGEGTNTGAGSFVGCAAGCGAATLPLDDGDPLLTLEVRR